MDSGTMKATASSSSGAQSSTGTLGDSQRVITANMSEGVSGGGLAAAGRIS